MKLRTKLVTAWILAGVLLTAIIVSAAAVVIERAVLQEVRTRIHCSSSLLNSALAASLAQRDYATLQQVVDETRRHTGIDYLVVSDRSGRRIASSGVWSEGDLAIVPSALPHRDADGEERFHVRVDLRYAEQSFGALHYAQSAAIVAEARAALFSSALQAALVALLAGAVILWVIAIAVTRPLARLMEASARVSRGDYDIRLQRRGNDEIAQLSAAFNAMCQAIRERVGALAEREAGEKRDRQQAEAANRAKSAFLAVTSHEIRTPLNGILGIAELMYRTPLGEEQRRYCETILASGRQLHGMLSDILDLAKVEAGKLVLESIEFDFAQLLREVAAVYAHLAADRGIRFEFEAAPGLPSTVIGDPTRLRQVLNNILANALKFTENGGVSLRCTAVPNADGASGARVRIVVQDSGAGIASEKLASIFEPFFQTEESTARVYGGTGLGLCITRGLVDLMHGRIGVSSEVGRGTCFTLDLPVAAVPVGAKPAAAPVPPRHAGGMSGRVLVAEDHPVNQLVVAEMLRKMGLAVVVVENGRLACEADRASDFDLLIMDCQMPVMDGYEATRRIRAAEAPGSHLPILALTANAFAGDREAALASGMDDFLTKPVGYDALQSAVGAWLQPRQRTLPPAGGAERAADAAPPEFDPGPIEMLAQAASHRSAARVVRAFMDCAPRMLVELESGMRRLDLDALGRTAHALKSSARSVGLARAATIAAEVERLARTGDGAAVGRSGVLAAALQAGAVRLQQELVRLEGEGGAAPAQP